MHGDVGRATRTKADVFFSDSSVDTTLHAMEGTQQALVVITASSPWRPHACKCTLVPASARLVEAHCIALHGPLPHTKLPAWLPALL